MRKTGATDAQIEAGAQRNWEATMGRPWAQLHELQTEMVMAKTRYHAQYLIPPDHRLLDADQVAALGRVKRDYARLAAIVLSVEARWIIDGDAEEVRELTTALETSDDDLAILDAVIGGTDDMA